MLLKGTQLIQIKLLFREISTWIFHSIIKFTKG